MNLFIAWLLNWECRAVGWVYVDSARMKEMDEGSVALYLWKILRVNECVRVFLSVWIWWMCFRTKQLVNMEQHHNISGTTKKAKPTSMCTAELHLSAIKISKNHCSSFLSCFWEHAARTISHFIAPVQWAIRESFKLGLLQVSSTVRKCGEMECELRTLIFPVGPATTGGGHGARMLSGAIPLGR